jgi:hypothetical protein
LSRKLDSPATLLNAGGRIAEEPVGRDKIRRPNRRKPKEIRGPKAEMYTVVCDECSGFWVFARAADCTGKNVRCSAKVYPDGQALAGRPLYPECNEIAPKLSPSADDATTLRRRVKRTALQLMTWQPSK